jgi:hypothetical protein
MPTPGVELDIEMSTPCGPIRPLHGVNMGPLHMNGWLDTPQRARTTPNDPRSGYALLAGTDGAARAGILLANARSRETDFDLALRGWPWRGKAVCRRYLLDYDRDLEFVAEDTLDEAGGIVKLCLPAPAFCYCTLMPDENVAEKLEWGRSGGLVVHP